jgi:hypothetical protein|tara:strand:+ start:1153 stop:1893 length:741 start_codon:yes stop_codon:yes gene_type:complete
MRLQKDLTPYGIENTEKIHYSIRENADIGMVKEKLGKIKNVESGAPGATKIEDFIKEFQRTGDVNISIPYLNKKVLCMVKDMNDEWNCNFCCDEDTAYGNHIYSENELSLYRNKYGVDAKPTECHIQVCRFLTTKGCTFTDKDRPSYFCTLYPLEINNKGKLVLTNESMWGCPRPEQYRMVDIKNGYYYYQAKRKHKRRKDLLVFDCSIEDRVKPIYLHFKETLISVFGNNIFTAIKNKVEKYDNG